MEQIKIYWNYLERILFGGTWNGTGTERVPKKLERSTTLALGIGDGTSLPS